jgi:(R)-2-hydroxyacyl-CoA dehydratese activating ATPase
MSAGNIYGLLLFGQYIVRLCRQGRSIIIDMKAAGLDIGSRTIKLVVIDSDGHMIVRKALTSHNPLETVSDISKGIEYDTLAATGYGRHLVKGRLGCRVISEIKAFAIGARSIHPASSLILDIGGQDIKSILLDESGSVLRFEMNDKCAAGTGRFLEVMAVALGYSLEEFSSAALSAERAEEINSMCAVFAESEVISLTARGSARNEVALGIHKAIVSRSTALLKRVSSGECKLFFAGGVALNECVRSLIAESLGVHVYTPPDPQIVGALGAALYEAGGHAQVIPAKSDNIIFQDK